jgi:membrane protein DedA with SNARE-associated domain
MGAHELYSALIWMAVALTISWVLQKYVENPFKAEVIFMLAYPVGILVLFLLVTVGTALKHMGHFQN